MFVNLGRPVRLWDCDPSAQPAVFTDGWFMGVSTRSFIVEYPAQVRVVGVHFKPWGMSPFVDVPAGEPSDRWVPVDAVWRRSVDRIRNQIGGSASAAEALRVVEAELRLRLAERPPRGLDLVLHTAGRLARCHGAVPISVLADAAGVSGNHPATQFKSHVGLTPKRMARIYRFAELLLSVDPSRRSTGLSSPTRRATSIRPTSPRSSRTSAATPQPATSPCGSDSPRSRHSRPTKARCPLIDFPQHSRP